jgi:lipopolysaccharide transport system permease protein
MISNANIIKKIYFPRLIIPISSILATLVDFSIQLMLFLIMLLLYGKFTSVFLMLLVLPISLLITLMTTLGLGSYLAALNVKYRDFRYLIPFMIQVLLFLSPIIYPVATINIPLLKVIFYLNPVATAIELLRNGLTATLPDWPMVGLGLVISAGLFVGGLYFFRKTEYYFADLA